MVVLFPHAKKSFCMPEQSFCMPEWCMPKKKLFSCQKSKMHAVKVKRIISIILFCERSCLLTPILPYKEKKCQSYFSNNFLKISTALNSNSPYLICFKIYFIEFPYSFNGKQKLKSFVNFGKYRREQL
jgi:hypothetical protein